MRLGDIKNIKILDPNVTRISVTLKNPDDDVNFRLTAGRVTDDDVRRLNELGCRITFLPDSFYPLSCRARLDLIPKVLTEQFIQEARVTAVDFTENY